MITIFTLILCTTIICAEQSLSDLSSARDIDYTFFNDPYLLEQHIQQPLYDLTKVGLSVDGLAPDAAKPIIDSAEAEEVDFSFFNDPYALDKFRTDLPVKAKFSGYVAHAAWWDSRQIIQFGDGYNMLYPKKRDFDPDCRDINARGQANMTMIETRQRIELFGPKILGAKSFAYIETSFFGNGIVINRLRMRSAFVQLTWPDSKVLLGQFWHPIFIIKTFPLTVSFDAGVPIAPFTRNPQVRFTYFKGNKEFLVAALAQMNFKSNGPIGFSTTYLRNARLPILIARAAYDTEKVYAGVGASFMRLKPRIKSNTGFRVNESINSANITAFATVKFEPVELRQQFLLAQNAVDLTLLNGFAVSSVEPITDKRRYTNINAASYWIDININRQIEPGLFIGILKNLGARRNIIPCITDLQTGVEEKTIYGLDVDSEQIDTLFRIAPRCRFHILPIDFATEVEYTRATFGCLDRRGRVKNADPIANTRLLFSASYYF